MIVKNKKRHNTILNILEKIKEQNIIDDLKDDFDDEIYVKGEKEILDKIKQKINEKFPECNTNDVCACYGPFEPCEDWLPEEPSGAWCLADCKQPQALCITTYDTKTINDIIEECFKGDE